MIFFFSFLSFADNWDPKTDLRLYRIYRICWTDFGEKKDEPNTACKSQYFAWLAWNSPAYGHVCVWKNYEDYFFIKWTNGQHCPQGYKWCLPYIHHIFIFKTIHAFCAITCVFHKVNFHVFYSLEGSHSYQHICYKLFMIFMKMELALVVYGLLD